MSITDHVAILANSALATPLPNKLKDGHPLEHFALLAFAPNAESDLLAMITERATASFGALHPDISMSVETNASRKKPLPGIPGDWLVVRGVSRFAPEIYGADGVQVTITPESTNAIRQLFYAGRRVRVTLAAWAWSHPSGKRGISFNLNGIMDAGPGERLPIGNNSSAAFAGHAQQGQAAPQQPAPQSANPFGGAQQAAANPFAQAANAPQSANPFAK
jgi:hypothetical protein